MKKLKVLFSILLVTLCVICAVPFAGCGRKYNVVEICEIQSLDDYDPILAEANPTESHYVLTVKIKDTSKYDDHFLLLIYESDFISYKCESLQELLTNVQFAKDKIGWGQHYTWLTHIDSEREIHRILTSEEMNQLRYALIYSSNEVVDYSTDLLNYLDCVKF